MDNHSAQKKYQSLLSDLTHKQRVAIAFSGGQDSTFLLIAAQNALGENVIAFTANTPYMAGWEIDEARELCRQYSIQHCVLDIPVIDTIKSNPPERCYLCKHNIFSLLKKASDELGITNVLDGTNSDDMRTHRPGIRALRELNIGSPLLENNFSKQDIIHCSRELGLPTWNKPAYACLLSRIPYNSDIDMAILRKIEQSERYLIGLGFRLVRVRAHNDLARIEVSIPDIQRLIQLDIREQVEKALLEFGFKQVEIDLRGYRSGCFDELISVV